MSKFHVFNNNVCLNLDEVESVSRPVLNDPYQKVYGPVYNITMTSGAIHEAYEFITESPHQTISSFGKIVMPRNEFFIMLRGGVSP